VPVMTGRASAWRHKAIAQEGSAGRRLELIIA
jgi:hypothetical protein